MNDIERVIFLEEASYDLETGKEFYESKESGIGFYFATSLLSDISSLLLYPGVHPTFFGFFRMLSKRFPFAIYCDIQESCSNSSSPGY